MIELVPHYREEAEKIVIKIKDFLMRLHEVSLDSLHGSIIVLMGENDVSAYGRKSSEAAETARAVLANSARPTMTTVMGFRNEEPFHEHIVYLPGETIVAAISGTVDEQTVFVEELSHALFSYSQIEKHVAAPHSAFLELVGVLDQFQYQLVGNPQVHEQAERLFGKILVGYSERYLQQSPEPHYYFAHKWALFMFRALTALRDRDGEIAFTIAQVFYEGNDGDRLYMLFKEIPEICRSRGIALQSFTAYDPSNIGEKTLFERIVREVNDPRIQIA